MAEGRRENEEPKEYSVVRNDQTIGRVVGRGKVWKAFAQNGTPLGLFGSKESATKAVYGAKHELRR